MFKNFSKRPIKAEISLGVIHFLSGINVDPDNKYDPDLCIKILLDWGTSAHILIDRDGIIYELVPDEYKAWHAGQSSYDGKKSVNNFSLGAELIGEYGVPFTDLQYRSIVWWANSKIKRHEKLTKKRWTGHENVATPKGRKKDPGPSFDWKRFKKGLK